jgi:hypothetical protein
MLNECPEDQGFALKQRATEALTTAFEEIPRMNGMELLRAGLVSRHAAVCQAMEDLVGVAERADSVLEWVEAMDPGEKRELVEDIGQSSVVGGLPDAERRIGRDFDEETAGRAIARWKRLVSELRWRGSPLSIEQWIVAKSADQLSMGRSMGLSRESVKRGKGALGFPLDNEP